jgi:hypothetical protein
MKRLAEEEIAREARRILRRLAGARMALFPRGADFAVARAPEAAVSSRLVLDADMAAAFLRAGWIAPEKGGRLVLAEAGRAFLARSLGGPDRFAAQHRQMESRRLGADEGHRPVLVNIGESPLARLKAKNLLDAVQFAAGEKLRRDFTLAQLTPRLGVDLSRPVVCGGARGPDADTVCDIALAARQRLSRALAAAGPGLSDLAFDVCCDLVSLERAEARRGWSRRSGRVVLRLALDRLATHYGMTVTRAHAPIRAWAADR